MTNPNLQQYVDSEFDFSGSLLINENEKLKNRFQIIFSSSSYGTDYSVYAQFNCEKIKNDNENIRVNIVFKIINYKGIINIGFDENEVTYEYDNKKETLDIKLHVKGLGSKLKSHNKKHNVILPRHKNIEVLVDRKLSTLSGKPASAGNSVEDCFVNGVFDNNYYYREGNFFQVRKDFDSMTMNDSIISENTDKLRPGLRCIIGKNIAYVL